MTSYYISYSSLDLSMMVGSSEGMMVVGGDVGASVGASEGLLDGALVGAAVRWDDVSALRWALPRA